MSTFVAIDKEEEEITAASAIQQLSISESAIGGSSTGVTPAANDSTPAATATSTATVPATAVTATPDEVPVKLIDWDEAMSSIGGSEEFLLEVVQDLLKEAATAEVDISTGMKNADLLAIMKAAHRICGSASYFSCEDLVGRASAIKHLAQEAWKARETAAAAAATDGAANPSASSPASSASPADAALIEEMTKLFVKFTTSVNALRAEVTRRFSKDTPPPATTASAGGSSDSHSSSSSTGGGAGL